LVNSTLSTGIVDRLAPCEKCIQGRPKTWATVLRLEKNELVTFIKVVSQ